MIFTSPKFYSSWILIQNSMKDGAEIDLKTMNEKAPSRFLNPVSLKTGSHYFN